MHLPDGLDYRQTVPTGKRILLGQLGANGDCLFATAIARQIKVDYPGCELTWAVGSAYRSVLDGNPYIDEIWEIPIKDTQELWDRWDGFEKEAFERKRLGDFDEVFLTEIAPGNYSNFDGTVRASIFRGYPHPMTVPDTPVLRLFAHEIANVKRFAEEHRLMDQAHIILFEYTSYSEQSFITPTFALEVAKTLVSDREDVCIILSSSQKIDSSQDRIIDGSVLTIRENAELTKYCTLLVGCSSGISWITTSDWAKTLPMVQVLSRSKSVYASFIHDYEYRGVNTDGIIELADCSSTDLSQCVLEILENGFSVARDKYSERLPVEFDYYVRVLFDYLIGKGKYTEALQSLKHVVKRYGPRLQLIRLLCTNYIRFKLNIR